MENLGAAVAAVKLVGAAVVVATFFWSLSRGRISLRRLRRDYWRWGPWV